MTKKIQGLEEAIDFWRSGALQSQEHLKHLMVLREAARAYAELQKGDMVIVPKEPTEEMLQAGWGGYCPHANIKDGLIYMWKAMLGAVE